MIHYSYMIVDPISAFGNMDELRRLFDFVRECGYEGVELNWSTELGQSLESVLNFAVDANLQIPSFLTGKAYQDGLCLSAPDPSVRSQAITYLINLIDVAHDCNSILVIGLLQGLRSDELNPEFAQTRIIECLKQVAAVAERKEVGLVIEPINHLQVGFNNSVTEVRALINEVGSSALRPMVDTIHMNIEDSSLTQPIYDCGKDLRHVHLCESNGALFGTGNIDFAPVLNALDDINYDGFASVKVYRKATHREAIQSGIEHLRAVRK